MKLSENLIALVSPLSLQEEFASVVRRVESLPLAAKRLGDFVRGRMAEAGSPFKACRRRVAHDESLQENL